MPNRVIVSYEGYAVPANIAEKRYGIIPDIVFKRNDNWTLGAPSMFETVAYNMWADQWIEFMINDEWKDINEYKMG